MPKLILASSSPRRKEIMLQMGLSFEVIPSYTAEFGEGDPVKVVYRNALIKARDIAGRFKPVDEVLIIGADTIVFKENKVLGKPQNIEEAAEMLRFLSGSWHSVYTAIAVCSPDGIAKAAVSETKVCFRKLDEKTIHAYLATGEPLDKAGAYGIQGRGAALISRIEGDYGTVVGMSPAVLLQLLEEHDVSVF